MSIATWYGRPIEELSKEELISALEALSAEILRIKVEHHRRLELLSKLGKVKSH